MGGKCWTQTYYTDPEVTGKYKLRMDYRDHLYIHSYINNNMVFKFEMYLK